MLIVQHYNQNQVTNLNLLRSFVPLGAGNEAMTVAAMKYMSSLNFVWQRTRRAKKNLRICAEEGNPVSRARFQKTFHNDGSSIIIILAGKPFPDFPIVELKTKNELRLSDLVNGVGAQPIVLNFGSCS